MGPLGGMKLFAIVPTIERPGKTALLSELLILIARSKAGIG